MQKCTYRQNHLVIYCFFQMFNDFLEKISGNIFLGICFPPFYIQYFFIYLFIQQAALYTAQSQGASVCLYIIFCITYPLHNILSLFHGFTFCCKSTHTLIWVYINWQGKQIVTYKTLYTLTLSVFSYN